MNAKASIGEDEKALMQIKEQMTEQQRSDMAEIIGNELKRREAMKYSVSHKSNVKPSRLSGGIGADDLKDIYENSDKNIQQLRVRALESKLSEAKKEASRFGMVKTSSPKNLPQVFSSQKNNRLPVILFGVAILVFAGLKSYSASSQGIKAEKPAQATASRASLDLPKKEEKFEEIKPIAMAPEIKKEENFGIKAPSSEAERAILMQLDQRRVELERRNQVLDQKEKELVSQAKLVTEKVTELKSLINKLSALRTEKDSKLAARMDQLASVYGAMAPNEASNLIAKLDEEVALGLLERMPEKRMAQILGVMEQSRAIELTKLLTNRKSL